MTYKPPNDWYSKWLPYILVMLFIAGIYTIVLSYQAEQRIRGAEADEWRAKVSRMKLDVRMSEEFLKYEEWRANQKAMRERGK